jgi:hypothetical protein
MLKWEKTEESVWGGNSHGMLPASYRAIGSNAIVTVDSVGKGAGWRMMEKNAEGDVIWHRSTDYFRDAKRMAMERVKRANHSN